MRITFSTENLYEHWEVENMLNFAYRAGRYIEKIKAGEKHDFFISFRHDYKSQKKLSYFDEWKKMKNELEEAVKKADEKFSQHLSKKPLRQSPLISDDEY